MGEFQRSPSKVWWAGEDSLNWRAASASPGSQDSGFSDTETSPRDPQLHPQNYIKPGTTEQQNLTSSIVEKSTPQKSNIFNGKNVEIVNPKNAYYMQNTPVRRPMVQAKSEPAGRFAKNKHQTKVSRNLFRSIQMESTMEAHQYAGHSSIGSEVTSQHSDGSSWSEDSEVPECVKTLPLTKPPSDNCGHNLSAPAILRDQNEGVTSFNVSTASSDCESELEGLFQEELKHTSTPKNMTKDNIKLGRLHAMNLMQKFKNQRVPPTTIESAEEGTALKNWLEELKPLHEPECMTTLQCKSIAGDLADKVSKMAQIATTRLRHILNSNIMIEKQFDNLKNEKTNKRPIALSIISLIRDLLATLNIDSSLDLQCCELETCNNSELPKNTAQLHLSYYQVHQQLMNREIKSLISSLEDPHSELEIRANLTALTSTALRNERLIETFINFQAVQAITTICEKCEGSSVRGLALRALSALCINACAIRKLEASNGVYIITETLVDESRPEPERVEAAALLAQITAPWIDDNHNINGLHKQSKRLVKHLTNLLNSTKCCQNILLCTAALANLTAMDQRSIKYLLNQNTVHILLDIIRNHGVKASIYLLEQVATLIANMSAIPEARVRLTNDQAPIALMCFLQSCCVDDGVVLRLQQKSMIGLSRLCREYEAAKQVVEVGGVEKLVMLCKEKKQRFDSDAILVAALATLRKIAEACGAQVVSAEDAQELIEPRLLDSFLAYSAQNESLV